MSLDKSVLGAVGPYRAQIAAYTCYLQHIIAVLLCILHNLFNWQNTASKMVSFWSANWGGRKPRKSTSFLFSSFYQQLTAGLTQQRVLLKRMIVSASSKLAWTMHRLTWPSLKDIPAQCGRVIGQHKIRSIETGGKVHHLGISSLCVQQTLL